MFRKVLKSTRATGLLCAGLAWIGVSGTAKAGWVFDHMEGSGAIFHNTNQWWRGNKVDREFNSSHTVGTESDGRGGWSSGGSSSLFAQTINPELQPKCDRPITCRAKMSATMQPVFRWEPEEIGWDEETLEPIYAPVSTRPIWIMEKANLEVTGFGGAVTMAADPFSVKMKSATTLPVQPDEDGRDPEPYTPDPVVHDEHTPNGRITKWFEGLKFQRIDPVGNKAYGQPRTFKYDVSVTRDAFETGREKMEAIVRYKYEVCEVHFGLMVRPWTQGNAGYAAMEGGPGSITMLSGGRSLMAGGVDDAAHKCEVWMTMDPPVLGILPAKCYPKVDFAFKKGKVKNAEFKPYLNARQAPCSTDWANWYNVYVGEVVSRDVTTGKPPVYPAVMLGYGGANPMVTLEMTWANVEWKMGENGEKEWGTIYTLTKDGYSEKIWCRLTSANHDPLTDHDVEFAVERLEVVVEDSMTGELITKIFTRDETEAANYVGDAHFQVICEQDLSTVTAPYISVGGGGMSDGNGVCKGTVSVKSDWDFLVKNFRVTVEDKGVFRKK